MKKNHKNFNDYKLEITNIIQNNISNLELRLKEYHVYDISQVVGGLDDDKLISFFNNVSSSFSAKIFENLDIEEILNIIKLISQEQTVKIIEKMEIDKAVDLIKFLKTKNINRKISQREKRWTK